MLCRDRRCRLAFLALTCGCGSAVDDGLAILEVSVGPEVPAFQKYRFSVPERPSIHAHEVPRDSQTSLSFGYYLPGKSGPITVLVQALADQGCLVAEGRASVQVSAGKVSDGVPVVLNRVAAACLAGADGGEDGGGPAPDAGLSADEGTVVSSLEAGASDAPPLDGPPDDVPAAIDVPVAADVPSPPDARKRAGTPCASGVECTSGSCADGVCCDGACDGQCESCAQAGHQGECLAVTGAPTAPRAACLGGGLCAGSCDGANRRSCSYPGPSTECAAAHCENAVATPRSLCDGKGGCPAAGTVSCAPFSCSGALCAGGCSDQQPCAADSYCNAGRCVAKQPAGSPCSGAEACASGSCVDGRCCSSPSCGTCQSCTGPGGTCAAVTGTDDPDSCTGTCDFAGACKKKQGQACGVGGECLTGVCADGKCCDKPCGGVCQTCATGACLPVTSAPDPDTCSGTCDASGGCKLGLGQPCGGDGSKCSSAICRDSVCCGEACADPCRSCATGTCAAVKNADDPDTCTGARTCDAAGACNLRPGACLPDTYRCNQLIGQVCDGNGVWGSNGSSIKCDCYEAGRYTRLSGGKVKDGKSGLTWDALPRGPANWTAASSACSGAGMRLPTVAEWKALNIRNDTVGNCRFPAGVPIDVAALPSVTSDFPTWTSDVFMAGAVYAIELNAGHFDGIDWPPSTSFHYRCVK